MQSVAGTRLIKHCQEIRLPHDANCRSLILAAVRLPALRFP